MKTYAVLKNEYSFRRVLDRPLFAWNISVLQKCGDVRFVITDPDLFSEAVSLYPEALIVPEGEADSVLNRCIVLSGGELREFSSISEFSQAVKDARLSVVYEHMAAGVDFIDPENVYIGPEVTIGSGAEIRPGTMLCGRTSIGSGCIIGPNSRITDCSVGSGTTVNSSDLNDSSVGCGAEVGPYAYLRPGCTIGSNTKIGDFCEIKNSTVGDDTKISHLTYVGDSDLGRNVNMGCGCVFVNYDGVKKSRTTVGDNAFIGCNTNLVSPVNVGEETYIAAGSTITEDVPAGAMAIGRSRQTIKPGYAKGRFAKVKKY